MKLEFWMIEAQADCTQRVMCKAQDSSWAHVKPGISPGSIFESLWFLTNVNDLPVNLLSNPKLCADVSHYF